MSDGTIDDGLRPSDRRTFLMLGLGAVLVLLAFLLGQCTSFYGDDEEPSVNAFDACQDLGDVPESLQFAAASLCNNEGGLGGPGLSEEALKLIDLQGCPDHRTPELTILNTMTGERELLFFGGMMVRFHPADVFSPGDPDMRPPDLGMTLVPEDGAQVWIVDSGEHGYFMADLVRELLPGSTMSTVDAGADDDALLKSLQAADLTSTVVFVDIGSRPVSGLELSGGDQLIAAESQVVDVLDTLHRSDLVAKEQMIMNLSFGAYSCETSPDALEGSMERLAEHGVQFVTAAGNDETAEQPWPASFGTASEPLAESVTNVGATDGLSGERSCFSNYGPTVEVWMPGQMIQGSLSDGSVGSWSGTSFAAPHAAAMLASGLDPVDLGFAADPAPPSVQYDVLVTIDGKDPAVEARTWCDPDGRFKPFGGVAKN